MDPKKQMTNWLCGVGTARGRFVALFAMGVLAVLLSVKCWLTSDGWWDRVNAVLLTAGATAVFCAAFRPFDDRSCGGGQGIRHGSRLGWQGVAVVLALSASLSLLIAVAEIISAASVIECIDSAIFVALAVVLAAFASEFQRPRNTRIGA
jgi:hypothetical protein